MRIVVLSRSASIGSTRRLVEAGRARGHQVRVAQPAPGPAAPRRQEGAPLLRGEAHAPLRRGHPAHRGVGERLRPRGGEPVRDAGHPGPQLRGRHRAGAQQDALAAAALRARRGHPGHGDGARALGAQGDGRPGGRRPRAREAAPGPGAAGRHGLRVAPVAGRHAGGGARPGTPPDGPAVREEGRPGPARAGGGRDAPSLRSAAGPAPVRIFQTLNMGARFRR